MDKIKPIVKLVFEVDTKNGIEELYLPDPRLFKNYEVTIVNKINDIPRNSINRGWLIVHGVKDALESQDEFRNRNRWFGLRSGESKIVFSNGVEWFTKNL
jgi:hypothetical protein